MRWPARFVRLLVVSSSLFAIALAGRWLLTDPDTPLPPEWNPLQPLQISDPVTPVTRWKLNRIIDDAAECQAFLTQSSVFEAMESLRDTEQCFVTNRVEIQKVGLASMAPAKTSCQIAVRLAMWERHALQPAAMRHLGEPVNSINHYGSYSCRPIRGNSTRMSHHATASAIDISGFQLASGKSVNLRTDWSAEGAKADFLKEIRDEACIWFSTVLGPDYNALHADHFHLQSPGWGICR